MVDYGFSKRLDECLDKWGREHVLRDMVGVIRTDRPLIVISRFQGNERDGHGNHSAAGLISQEAFARAADPQAFPDQIAAGLRPWQPLKLYMGGVRADEDWTIRVDTGEYDPVLGESYQSLARLGLSFQRSQTSGRFSPQPGPSLGTTSGCSQRSMRRRKNSRSSTESTPRSGDCIVLLGKSAPAGVEASLAAIDSEIDAAVGGIHDQRSVGVGAGAGAGAGGDPACADAKGSRS